MRILGVSKEDLSKFGKRVSEERLAKWATGVRTLFIWIWMARSGIAGPDEARRKSRWGTVMDRLLL